MLVGHYAPAFALKAHFRDAPLWALLLAVQALDILFFALVVLGVEKVGVRSAVVGPLSLELTHMPWSHSLPMAGIYCALTATICRFPLGNPSLGFLLSVAIGSHWLCDLLVHTPDLPLSFGDAKIGIGFWYYPIAEFFLEIGLLIATTIWLVSTLGSSVAPRSILCLAGFLIVIQFLNTFVVPLPQSKVALAVSSEVFYFLVAGIGLFVDRHSVASKSHRTAAIHQ